MASHSASLLLLLGLTFSAAARAQQAPTPDLPPQATQPTPPAPITREPPPAPPPPVPAAPYDPSLFQRPLDPAQLAALQTAAGTPSGQLFRDKLFRTLMKAFVPDCMFHYGRDMPLADALDLTLAGSGDPVQLRDNRFLLLSGERGPYLAGRALLWLDLQTGIALGAFFFTPTNGEPTPSLAVFSRQVKAPFLSLSDLPPAFAQDLATWSVHDRVPEITPRYFLTGDNKRLLLEHDEDLCALGDGTLAPPGSGCEQLNAEAADIDETTAYYLQQVHYATNATAWMIGPDQVAWITLRDRSCLGLADPLGCRIRVTRQHTRILIHHPTPLPSPRSGPRR